jgi:hypothetical protein
LRIGNKKGGEQNLTIPIAATAFSAAEKSVEVLFGGRFLACFPNGCRVIVPVQCDADWLRELFAAVRDTAGLIPNIPEAGSSC